MVIVYGYREKFKREGYVGHSVCRNCGHDADQTLCRELLQFNLFGIPIVNKVKQMGIMCESCGNIVPLGKKEYKERKKNAADEKAGEY